MTKSKNILLVLIFILITLGCRTNEVTLYTNKDKSAIIYITHHTEVLPRLGPCGFVRSFDYYTIDLPDIRERYEWKNIKINCMTCESNLRTYRGFLELNNSRLLVNLFEVKQGKESPLSINGKHKYKKELNEMAR